MLNPQKKSRAKKRRRHRSSVARDVFAASPFLPGLAKWENDGKSMEEMRFFNGKTHTETVCWKLYEFTDLDELQHVYKPSITCL